MRPDGREQVGQHHPDSILWRKLREIKLSAFQLAKDVGVHPKTIYNYIEHQRAGRFYIAWLISKRTGLSLDEWGDDEFGVKK